MPQEEGVWKESRKATRWEAPGLDTSIHLSSLCYPQLTTPPTISSGEIKPRGFHGDSKTAETRQQQLVSSWIGVVTGSTRWDSGDRCLLVPVLHLVPEASEQSLALLLTLLKHICEMDQMIS